MANTELERVVRRPGPGQVQPPGPGTEMPFLDFGGSGPQLMFLHANAYPPAAYGRLFGYLTDAFRIRAPLQRPLWAGSRPADIKSWHVLSQDLLQFLQVHANGRSAVVGHSLGATVALRAALAEPFRFAGLVLLDPVIVSRASSLKWRALRGLGFGHRLHSAIKRAGARRMTFTDLDEAFRAYRPHNVFQRMGDAELKEMIAGLFVASDAGGYRLVYPPEWEARVYMTALWHDDDLWAGLPNLRVPTLIIRGAESDTLSAAVCGLVKAANPAMLVQTVKRASHLVPLERPLEVMQLIQAFVQDTRDVGRSVVEGNYSKTPYGGRV